MPKYLYNYKTSEFTINFQRDRKKVNFFFNFARNLTSTETPISPKECMVTTSAMYTSIFGSKKIITVKLIKKSHSQRKARNSYDVLKLHYAT